MNRLHFIDTTKGLAVLAMIHIHVVNAFLQPSLAAHSFSRISHFFGGGAAPIFLSMAGLSCGLVCGQSALSLPDTSWHLFKRGMRILGWALLFRLQEWILGGASLVYVRDLLRVDVLNCIGVTLMFLALVFMLFGAFKKYAPWIFLITGLTIILHASRAAHFAFLAYLPNALRYYITETPRYSLFPLFGWAGLAFIGFGMGLYANAPYLSKQSTQQRLLLLSRCSLLVYLILLFLRVTHLFSFGFHKGDSSPYFLLERLSLSLGLLVIVERLDTYLSSTDVIKKAHLYVRSFLGLLGRHSLLIYWVHVELVYGLWLHRYHERCHALACMFLSLLISVLMYLLAKNQSHIKAYFFDTFRLIKR